MIHARNFAGRVALAELTALVDARKETVEESCRELGVKTGYQDYRQALADPRVHAVVVVVPTVLHREIVVAAARAGKHVLCEKPMAMNPAECDEMVAACDSAGVKLQIGFMRRFDASFMAARQRIDTLRWFAGSEIVEVYAVGGNFRCPQARTRYPDFYDSVSMVGRFADGRQGFIDGAVAVGYGYDARTEIVGTKGVMFVGRIEQDGVVACSTASCGRLSRAGGTSSPRRTSARTRRSSTASGEEASRRSADGTDGWPLPL